MPMNPATGTGWKKDSDIPCKKDKEVVECIEKNAYLADEVLVNIGSSFQVMDFFHDTLNAMWKMLNFNPGVITHKIGSEPVRLPASTIQLNGTLSYYLAILDPNLHFWAESPDILPRSFLRLKENTSYLVHMKVQ